MTTNSSQFGARQMLLLWDPIVQHSCNQRIEPDFLFQLLVPALYTFTQIIRSLKRKSMHNYILYSMGFRKDGYQIFSRTITTFSAIIQKSDAKSLKALLKLSFCKVWICSRQISAAYGTRLYLQHNTRYNLFINTVLLLGPCSAAHSGTRFYASVVYMLIRQISGRTSSAIPNPARTWSEQPALQEKKALSHWTQWSWWWMRPRYIQKRSETTKHQNNDQSTTCLSLQEDVTRPTGNERTQGSSFVTNVEKSLKIAQPQKPITSMLGANGYRLSCTLKPYKMVVKKAKSDWIETQAIFNSMSSSATELELGVETTGKNAKSLSCKT